MIEKAELIKQTLEKIAPEENAYKVPTNAAGNNLFHDNTRKLTIKDLKKVDETSNFKRDLV